MDMNPGYLALQSTVFVIHHRKDDRRARPPNDNITAVYHSFPFPHVAQDQDESSRYLHALLLASVIALFMPALPPSPDQTRTPS